MSGKVATGVVSTLAPQNSDVSASAHDRRGVPLVSATLRRLAQPTPTAADIADAPADAIYLSATANVTLRLENDTADVTLTALTGGVWHALAVRRLVTVSTGTATLGWYR